MHLPVLYTLIPNDFQTSKQRVHTVSVYCPEYYSDTLLSECIRVKIRCATAAKALNIQETSTLANVRQLIYKHKAPSSARQKGYLEKHIPQQRTAQHSEAPKRCCCMTLPIIRGSRQVYSSSTNLLAKAPKKGSSHRSSVSAVEVERQQGRATKKNCAGKRQETKGR